MTSTGNANFCRTGPILAALLRSERFDTCPTHARNHNSVKGGVGGCQWPCTVGKDVERVPTATQSEVAVRRMGTKLRNRETRAD